MDIMQALREKAQKKQKIVALPEAEDCNILLAARYVLDEGIAQPLLVGQSCKISKAAQTFGISLEDMRIVEPDTKMCTELVKCLQPSGLSEYADMYITRPLYYAALMVRQGMADAMVAGLSFDTADVIMASRLVIGLKEGITTPSSLFIMNIPGFQGPEGNLIVFADGGVWEEPNVQQVADIAICTADTIQDLLGWQPRVALLSYSTKGSASGPSVDKMLDAVAHVRQLRPDISVDGEFQLDAAIIPEVAKRKVRQSSQVAGKANILIFPDLDAANICYKAVQRFANADAYGPLLQGFAKTVSDLSRGSTVEDIIGVITITCARD